MSEKFTFEEIEAYLAGKHAEVEVGVFETRMKEDASFAKEVEAQQIAHQAVDLYSRIKLKEKVKRLQEASHEKSSLKISPNLLWLAASILILIAFGSLWYGNRAYSNEALIASSYTPPSFNLRSADTSRDSLFQELGNAYASQNYLQALTILNSLPSSTQTDYIRGSIYLETGPARDAIVYLRRVVATGDIRYVDNAQLALVMAHLLDNDEKQANVQLDEILENPTHSLRNKASDLKKKLNSFWRKLGSITSK